MQVTGFKGEKNPDRNGGAGLYSLPALGKLRQEYQEFETRNMKACLKKSTTKRKQIKKISSVLFPYPLSKNLNLSKLNNSVSPLSERRNL